MAVRIENQYSGKLPRNTISVVESAIATLPREHLRGVERVRLVDSVLEPRARVAAKGTELPGLYHPRQGVQGGWFEVAIGALIPSNKPFHREINTWAWLKGHLARVVCSLAG